jgi:copper chaperone
MIEFQIQDMSCNHCVAAISKAVKSVDADGRVDVDLATKRVRIESRHPAKEFTSAIEEAGYTPVLAAGG